MWSDSIKKGELITKKILINQNNAGNCAIVFEKGIRYVITGIKVNKAKQTYRPSQESHDPYLDELVQTNYMITTDMCRSFEIGSESAGLLLKN